MDWSYPVREMLAQDPEGMGTVLARLQIERGTRGLQGARFVSSTEQMLNMTRQIEDAVLPGEVLFVGFQRGSRLIKEVPRYRAITERGVEVIAFAVDDTHGEARKHASSCGVRLVEVMNAHRELEGQWFLIAPGASRIAFVGYDISSPDETGRGDVGERSFVGFVSEDPQVLESLLERLGAITSRLIRPQLSAAAIEAAAGAHRIAVATDDGANIGYARARDAATRLAVEVGAELLLYDRSAESSMTDPYPYPEIVSEDETLDRLAAVQLRREYLADQIDDATSAGVKASAWLPVRPGPKGMRTFVERFKPDLIVLPEELADPSLYDRLRGNTLDRFRAAVPIPIFLATADGLLPPSRRAPLG